MKVRSNQTLFRAVTVVIVTICITGVVSLSQTPTGGIRRPLEDLPQNYSVQKAIDDGCYVDLHGNIYNKDSMAYFIHRATQKRAARLRAVLYTIEGDPIVTDYIYNGEYFLVTQDMTRDMFGSREVIHRRFGNFVRYYDPEQNITYYFITDLSQITQEQFKAGIRGVSLKGEIE